MLVIKVGGSAITNKKVPYSLKEDVINNVARQLAQIDEPLILIHGVGSFGHPPAKKYKIGGGYDGTHERVMGLMLTHFWVDELSQRFIKVLLDYDLAALRCRPTTVFVTDQRRIVEFFAEPLERFVQMGMIPVLHGDGPADRSQGFCVLSGDQIAVFLAKHFGARKVIFGMDVPGVLKDQEIISEMGFDQIPYLQEFIIENHDASGGLHKKLLEIQQLAGSGIPAQLVGLEEPDTLLKAAQNQLIGTTIQ